MTEVKTDLKKAVSDKSIALLNPALASATDLMLSTKEAHWNVRGPHFIALHLFFDTLNKEMGTVVDDLAERCVQLGGHALGTLGEAHKGTQLHAYPGNLHAEKEHLQALLGQFTAFSIHMRQGIDAADQAGDKDTSDLFTQISRGLDKQIWFIEAHLA
jgi:starvation-inducible DNA-binding protein